MSSIKKNLSYNILYQVLNMILPLATAPYVSRTVGVDGVGTYSYIHSVVSYFMMFSVLGLSNYGNREISRVREDRESRSNKFWQIYYMQLGFSLISLAVYNIFILFFYSGNMIIYAVIANLCILASLLDINWFYFGMEQFKITVTRNCVIRILTAAATFIFVKDAGDLWIYVLILTGSTFLTQLVLWLYIKKYVDFKPPVFSEIKKHIKPNFVLFLPVFAISLYEVMDKIMLGLIGDVTQIGFYESANKIIKMSQTFFAALGVVMLPRISGLIFKDEKKANSYIRDSMQMVVFFAVAMMFGIMAIAERFVPIFYGDGFENSIILLVLMSPVLLFSPWKSVIRTQCLIPRGKDKSYIISVFLGAIFNLAINAMLIPSLGAKGAVYGTLVAEIVVCIYQTYAVLKILPVNTYFADNWSFLIMGGIMYVILHFVIDPMLPSGIIGIVLMALIGVAVYAVLFFGVYRFINKERYNHLISMARLKR